MRVRRVMAGLDRFIRRRRISPTSRAIRRRSTALAPARGPLRRPRRPRRADAGHVAAQTVAARHSHLATGCRAAAKFAGELLGIQLRGPLGLALPSCAGGCNGSFSVTSPRSRQRWKLRANLLNALGKKERGRMTRQGVSAPTSGARRCGCVDPSETAVSWMPPQAMEASTGLP